MTGPDPSDEKLRTAFQSLGDASRDEPSVDELDRVWRAVSGELPAAERRDLIDRMASDPALAEAWRIAGELQRVAPETVPASASRSARWWTQSWVAAAAVLLITVAVAVIVQRSRPAEDTFRQPGGFVIESLVGDEASLPRATFRLRWTPGPQGSRYQVRVTTDDLRVLTTAADLTAAELIVGADALASVPPGSRVLWQVDATLPGGETISSRTFVARVQ